MASVAFVVDLDELVVLLLIAGDKGSQERDVRRAKEIAAREKV